MLILSLRTDKPEAEIGLFDDTDRLAYDTWQAHRQLAETLHTKITAFLKENGRQLADLEGLVCYQGPGSFTGLRIGLSVANALAYGLDIPISGAEHDTWLDEALERLIAGNGQAAVMPEYGSPVHITPPKS